MAKDIGNSHKTVNTVFVLHVTRLQLSSLADFFSFQKFNSVNSDVDVQRSTLLHYYYASTEQNIKSARRLQSATFVTPVEPSTLYPPSSSHSTFNFYPPAERVFRPNSEGN